LAVSAIVNSALHWSDPIMSPSVGTSTHVTPTSERNPGYGIVASYSLESNWIYDQRLSYSWVDERRSPW
jgi:hypothetical protein